MPEVDIAGEGREGVSRGNSKEATVYLKNKWQKRIQFKNEWAPVGLGFRDLGRGGADAFYNLCGIFYRQ